ncbi:MAG TPA: biotin/lipoyl-containing protein, partial [Bordetella sp.]
MAITDVVVPQLSESISEATLLNWKKKAGEAVAADEILIEVETDKVVLEVPAPASGVLAEIVEGDGATVTSGQLLAKIDTAATAAAAPAAAPAPVAAAPAPVAAAPAPAAAPASTAAAGVASPAAAKILAEKGVDAAAVAGSGRDGRVTKGDALSATPAAPAGAAKPAAAAPAAPPTLSLDGRPEQRVPMSRLRARIAERLLQSQQENAILTTFNEVNMKAVIDL